MSVDAVCHGRDGTGLVSACSCPYRLQKSRMSCISRRGWEGRGSRWECQERAGELYWISLKAIFEFFNVKLRFRIFTGGTITAKDKFERPFLNL